MQYSPNAISAKWLGSILAQLPRTIPMASPLFGNFKDLPPLYVQALGNDLLRDDCFRLRDAYFKQNLGLKLELIPGMPRSFQFFAGNMPEAGVAISKSADFLEGELAARKEPRNASR